MKVKIRSVRVAGHEISLEEYAASFSGDSQCVLRLAIGEALSVQCDDYEIRVLFSNALEVNWSDYHTSPKTLKEISFHSCVPREVCGALNKLIEEPEYADWTAFREYHKPLLSWEFDGYRA